MANAQVVWDALRKNGLSEIFTAAFMGNLYAESGLIPNNMENGYEGTYNDTSYTNAVNNKSYSRDSFINDSIGYGLAQWTYWSRKQGLYDATVARGISIADLSAQLSYLFTESEYKSTVSALNSLSASNKQNLDVCTETVCWTFENPGIPHMDTRKKAAKSYYETYAGRSVNASSSSSSSSVPARTRPQVYLQWDSRWGGISFENASNPGATIATSACGPTCAAMVIATIANSSVTPETTCWYAQHFPTEGSGSYRGRWSSGVDPEFYASIFSHYGISSSLVYSYSSAIEAIGQGKMVITNVGPGLWTSAGHWILPYGLTDGGKTILVNDPNSESSNKTRASVDTFKRDAGDGPFIIINTPWTSATPSASDVDGALGYTGGGAVSNSTAASGVNYSIEYKEVTAEVKTSHIVTADADANALRTRANNLLTTPTLVESPFIWLKIGDFTFGSYSKEGSFDKVNSSVSVTYPNYMTSIQITKVNGQVNQYVINMTYQIRNGDDPNLLDKIFSSVGYGTVLISYGDWNASKFAYKEEEAIITKLDTVVDFANSRINYTLYCTSNALVLSAGYHNFPSDGTPVKPSEEIRKLIFNDADTYHLREVFNGFQDETFFHKCVAGDDVAVEIETKNGIDVLSYINYLVTCMSPTSTPKSSPIRDANYYLTICEDKERGTYFTVKKVSSSEGIMSLNNTNVYEVDVGYPGDTMVTSFKINNDNSWSLLYNYSESINAKDYTYNVDADGNIYNTYSPGVTTSSKYLRTTETQRNWWTQMTQFPVTAVLTIKGLLRPAMLMSYVRVNALFYGLRHVSSGLYIITKQVDTIDASGYRTQLSLTRVAGDLDVIVTEKKTITKQIPVRTTSSSSSSPSYTNSAYSGSSPESVSSGTDYVPSTVSGFSPRVTAPEEGNKFYNNWQDGGYNTCIRGNENGKTGHVGLTALPNCTGYAIGRFNEIIGSWKYDLYHNAVDFVDDARDLGLQVSSGSPQVGAILCWGYNGGGAGHVAVVEKVNSDGSILISQSGWSNQNIFWTEELSKGEWASYSGRYFRGFIYNPGVTSKSTSIRDLANAQGNSVASYY